MDLKFIVRLQTYVTCMHVYCYCLAGLGRSGGTLSRVEKVSDEKHYYLHQLANIFLHCWWLNYCMYMVAFTSWVYLGVFKFLEKSRKADPFMI